MGEDIMYRKYVLSLFLCNMIVLASFCCLKIVERSRYAATPAFRMQLQEGLREEEASSMIGSIDRADSGRESHRLSGAGTAGGIPLRKGFPDFMQNRGSRGRGEDLNGRILVAT